jgi:anthranilate synthase
MTAITHDYQTRGGVRITRRTAAADSGELERLMRALDARRGLLLASSYEYPGRYKRYDVGFVDPVLTFESVGRDFTLRANGARGEVLLHACEAGLRSCDGLESVTRGDGHIIGRAAERTRAFTEEDRTRAPSVFSALRALCHTFDAPDDALLGLYGAFGYDLVFQLEALQMRRARTPDARESVLYLPDQLLVIDHEREHCTRYSYDFAFGGLSTHGLERVQAPAPFVKPPADAEPGVLRDHEPGAFEAVVERAREAFAAGDLFEVTPSQEFLQPCAAEPSTIFTQLRRDNPAPYGFLANLGRGEFLIGASPEMYVRVRSSRVETCPIAGTIARGGDALGDAAQILALLSSEKDTAELTMCTDVDRNDKARICEPGSVRVIGRRQIELYSRLIHTVDHVEGRLREGYDAIDALLTHMWAVTLTGAPKLDAMQFIEACEQSPRGYYGGAIGALRFDGSLDTGLVLRTVQLQSGLARVRAGATLHFDSDPAAEQRECELKASAVLSALARAVAPARAGQTRVAAPPAAAGLRVLLIDHRDSFVHTLGDYFRQAGCQVTTLRHGFDVARYDELAPQLVVLSPGPMRPDDFAMRATLRQLEVRRLPVFGVCLGLQGMVEYCGGSLERLARPVHGKASPVRARRHPLFEGIPEQFRVGRYHSLYARPDRLPSALEVLAATEADGCIMSVAHRALPWTAVQFHPESILSADGEHGLRLIRNVTRLAAHPALTYLASDEQMDMSEAR